MVLGNTGVPRLTRFLIVRFHFTRILDLSKSQILQYIIIEFFMTFFFCYTMIHVARISRNADIGLPQKTRQPRDACMLKMVQPTPTTALTPSLIYVRGGDMYVCESGLQDCEICTLGIQMLYCLIFILSDCRLVVEQFVLRTRNIRVYISIHCA